MTQTLFMKNYKTFYIRRVIMSDLLWARVFELEAKVKILLEDQKVQTEINAELIKLIKEK
jgi:hypothetical protein